MSINIIEIKDFDAEELDVYARLSEGQLLNRAEPGKGIFIAESPKVIERALHAGYEPISCLIEKKHIDGEGKNILEKCNDIYENIMENKSNDETDMQGFPVYTAEFDILTKLTGFKLTRGMLCAMRRKPLQTLEKICDGAKRIAILENVMNPTNVGAIFRSAAALNIDEAAIHYTEGQQESAWEQCFRYLGHLLIYRIVRELILIDFTNSDLRRRRWHWKMIR